MRQLTDAMRTATAEAPPTTIDLDRLIAGEQRRRSRIRLIAVAGAVVLAAGTVPVVTTLAGPTSLPPAAPAGPTVGPSPDLPRGPGMSGWTSRAAALVAGSLPDGFQVGSGPTAGWASNAAEMWVDIAADHGGGSQLIAYLELTGDPAPVGDVCAAPPNPHRSAGTEVACSAVAAGNGLMLRAGIARDLLPGTELSVEFPVLTRYGEGWAVHVWELPYRHPLNEPVAEPEVLGTPVFTTRQLAELAAHPDLEPSKATRADSVSWEVPADDLRAMRTAVSGWLPDGIEVGTRSTPHWADTFTMMWFDLVTAGGERTQLIVNREITGNPVPPGNLCALPALAGHKLIGHETTCRTSQVVDRELRIATIRYPVDDPDRPGSGRDIEVPLISRYGEGWELHIWQPIESPYETGTSQLDRLAVRFAEAELIGLALDPQLGP